MNQAAGALEPILLTPHVALRRVEIVVNPLSGSVGPKAAAECDALLKELRLEANIVEAEAGRVEERLGEAMARLPDLVVVLAGDGTARAAAAMAGPNGPLIMPLPGGTMNLLPRALYDTTDWRKALTVGLADGVSRTVAGGSVGGRTFYCAAILGAPALWAPAREAVRIGKLRLAWLYARRAARGAFSRRLRYSLDDHAVQHSEALALITPLISKALDEPRALEAAGIDLKNAAEAFRLATAALFADWRADPSVEAREARVIHVSARQPIPAVLDGEPADLGREVEVRFLPVAFRALAPPRKPPSQAEKA